MRDPVWVERDPEWRTTLRLFDAPILRAKNCRRFVNFNDRTIDVQGLLWESRSWSHAEQLMLAVAIDFFNGQGESATVGEIVRVLDDENFLLVLEAMRDYRSL